ncbi:MAG: protein kinase [Sandaracinaceae bacterium]
MTDALRTPPRRGERLGRYRLCLELANGGMASVYLARAEGEAGFEKLVAVKVIHPHLTRDSAFTEMFFDEARVASRIDHANVCQTFDFGREGETQFLAMEYLAGEPLSRVFRAGAKVRTDPRRRAALIARIVADACEGLHAAHELADASGRSLEVVHRDVSPHNLFVTFDGVCKVVDFGIARARGRLHQTNTGMVKGKFSYMSPEQLRSEPIDRRADVWALGVILFEGLTGRRLFRRDSDGATTAAVLTLDVPAPSSIVPGIPEGLDDVVLWALARDPEERCPSARELARALLPFTVVDGAPMGLHDVAAWMDELFVGARRERAALEALATQLGDAVPTRATEATIGSGVEALSDLDTRASRRWARSPAILVAGAVLGVCAAVGLYLGLRDGEPDPRPALSARVEPVPPPDRAPDPPSAPEPVRDPAPATPSADPDPSEAPEPEPASEPRRGRSTRRPRAPGVVNIATPGGWASVRLGARTLGNTPLRVELDPGSYVLSIHPFGRASAETERVTVRSGEVTRVRHPVGP